MRWVDWAALDYRGDGDVMVKHALATPWMSVHAINLPRAVLVQPLL